MLPAATLALISVLGLIAYALSRVRTDGRNEEKLKRVEADNEAIAKGIAARHAVKRASRVPIDQDPDNLDRSL